MLLLRYESFAESAISRKTTLSSHGTFSEEYTFDLKNKYILEILPHHFSGDITAKDPKQNHIVVLLWKEKNDLWIFFMLKKQNKEQR